LGYLLTAHVILNLPGGHPDGEPIWYTFSAYEHVFRSSVIWVLDLPLGIDPFIVFHIVVSFFLIDNKPALGTELLVHGEGVATLPAVLLARAQLVKLVLGIVWVARTLARRSVVLVLMLMLMLLFFL